ncbi:WhiB family transcriptional regulator [Nocardia transvalensis]|nr:WhiB family transcriptional regulator [Nocardia transvalensis]
MPWLVDDDDEYWQEFAVCAQTDPELFFPDKNDSTRPAKRICAVCPVEDRCLQYALEHGIRFGVWGGKSAHERRRLTPHTAADLRRAS